MSGALAYGLHRYQQNQQNQYDPQSYYPPTYAHYQNPFQYSYFHKQPMYLPPYQSQYYPQYSSPYNFYSTSMPPYAHMPMQQQQPYYGNPYGYRPMTNPWSHYHPSSYNRLAYY
ncbi:hypothetical protein DM01DRAFT_1335023 [Hesseltinella vesiculosa]|uniref:Uncharacterized protein n=1 Tax=Hesseltinella vesiculosa TaxID=101127 RepID=A0A1X2GK55_9FUNG|nr:hypothetical protein DM01DRAFT_1335023 [Hesseltinella vesiculosa]